ncbi:MAG: DUF3592 domain-containing protein [Spirosomataceae bacterium]
MFNRVFTYIFGGIGLVMLAVTAFLVYSQYQFLSSSVKTTGVVIDNIGQRSKKSTTYTPVIAFQTANGKPITFQGSVSSSPPAFDINEKVEVYYNPANPQEAAIGTFFQLWFLPLIFGILGTIFSSIGLGFGVSALLHRRKIASLSLNGQRIKAHLQSVQLDRSIRSGNRSPFRIYCQWQDSLTGNLYVFKSDALWFDPSPYVGQQMDVLIDPQNPKRYWVDTSSLPRTV